MAQARLRAVFMRGGTSKAIIFRQSDLPTNRADWEPIFLSAIGAPDPNGRQLDGMGGGVSSLSKICIVGPPTHRDADVDYTFAQVGVQQASVSYGANCGNMLSAIGPFAVDEGLVAKPVGSEAVVRIHNTNTNKLMIARFGMDGGFAATEGDFSLDGVAGTGAKIQLDFRDPAGSKCGRLLPTGNVEDELQIPGIGALRVSLVDAAAACVLVKADNLGLEGTELPDAIESNKSVLELLQIIRRRGAIAMGLARDEEAAASAPNVPLIAMVSSPVEAQTLSGSVIKAEDIDIMIRMISMGQAHRASPLTGALCVAVATNIPGTIPNQLRNHRQRSGNGDVVIGHPSGTLQVGAEVTRNNGEFHVSRATVYRTARRLFQGEVLVRADAVQARERELAKAEGSA